MTEDCVAFPILGRVFEPTSVAYMIEAELQRRERSRYRARRFERVARMLAWREDTARMRSTLPEAA